MKKPDILNEYVDLDKYPIHELDSESGKSLLAICHDMMIQDTLCLLPGFLRHSGLKLLCDEITAFEDIAHQVDYPSTMYGWMNNRGFPPDHPRSILLRRKCGVITTDQLPSNGHCVRLFKQDVLTEFVRRLLGYETLYISSCPTLAIQINVMKESQEFGWHYDTNDGVVSLSIQNAEHGGGFEYAPLIRDEENENYAEVGKVASSAQPARKPDIPPGTFSLFLGRRSLHRVAPVGSTRRTRLSLLFSYDRQPGMVFPDETCKRLTSFSREPYMGAGTVKE